MGILVFRQEGDKLFIERGTLPFQTSPFAVVLRNPSLKLMILAWMMKSRPRPKYTNAYG